MKPYDEMLRALQSGQRLPAEVIDATLAAAGRTVADLAADLLAGVAAGPGPGAVCPACRRGILKAVSCKPRGPEVSVQYIACDQCTFRTKRIIPSSEIRRRKARTKLVRKPKSRPTARSTRPVDSTAETK
ncbi:MAG: hypothetical protein NTW96_25950 [Planctomycetia bacterium]|nr:hypothetical protein [Planctomycetia bacterium]